MPPALEQLLVQHCAPTLLGAKAASLISLSRSVFECPCTLARQLHERFAPSGLCFTVLGGCARRVLLYVYRPALLQKALSCRRAQRILGACGYPLRGELEALLTHLRRRIGADGGFPHEIGLFLDYPPGDVEAFIQTGGAGCKLCGYWKVYTDVEAARRRFARFDDCRARLRHMLAAGQTLSALLEAA
ncbi:DUF3793 family protein [Feifania hominis]|uniref:DUF3793 family protein n=1 Tax=Feifania hominis TaxID=2763660 RepID=A0A926DED1_9FIRM|nr:DUF3793 family protein [Feifania hominis]MBC8536302.1 DUF3793 family protein [Feifania hominis]